MPSITQKEIDRFEKKSGIYSKLRKSSIITISSIEHIFREYAKKHVECTVEMENSEWEKFNRILQKYL